MSCRREGKLHENETNSDCFCAPCLSAESENSFLLKTFVKQVLRTATGSGASEQRRVKQRQCFIQEQNGCVVHDVFEAIGNVEVLFFKNSLFFIS